MRCLCWGVVTMRSRATLCARLLVSLLVASCGESSDGSGASDDGPPAFRCDQERRALVEMIEENRTCKGDEDCQYLVSFCLVDGRVDCTGAFYVNTAVSSELFQERDDAYTECLMDRSSDADDCGTCLAGSRLPYCDNGVCAASDVYADSSE